MVVLVFIYSAIGNDRTVVVAQRSKDGLQCGIILQFSVNIDSGHERLGGSIRLDRDFADVGFADSFQPYVADDSVPVGLCVLGIGVTAAEQLWRNGLIGIVDADGQLVLACREEFRQIESLGSRDVRTFASEFAVDEDLRGLGSFQMQHDGLFPPFLRDFHHARIGQFAYITEKSRQSGGLVFLFYGLAFSVSVGGSRQGYVAEFCLPSSRQIDMGAVSLSRCSMETQRKD